ncbi:sigma-70 family RNA polymerase sigma factor [Phycisphaera mikurensis]|uniref:Putative RNA polymerase sigma factor n=1 Tax=Phycisphaera mikurensis (strain NBRC 102666 / KCTC 22515 / FYK2301M01) TaxID=1142394 RepID=I0IB18_PHYMF|nr:sigma-70 family RNA polymerase sigma factor [Phycisphaera mikurensis]MBB6442573.1 RNA polymerase primary sigma factor [Phycisphaera mikurensis]BAM02456.1 putative RNA polymerase sigma factor [Phycisphaera mikurensis NBRC 102666]
MTTATLPDDAATASESTPSARPLRFHAALSAAERATLRELLAGPYEYMEDALYDEPDAEERIFDADVPIGRPSTAWYGQLAYEPRDTPRGSRAEKLPLLTPAEEKVAFLRFNYCRYRAERARLAIEGTHVGLRKGRELLHWHRQSHHWRELIAEYNLGLVLAMARRLPSGHVDYPEMISEGNMALLRGIDKFRVDKGFKFSTYACRAILKAFSRTGIKASKIKSLFPVGFEPDYERSNHSAEKNAAEERACVEEVRRIYEDNAADLSEIELSVVEKRFSFDDPDREKNLTLQQVGKMVGLTKERVRQIQIGAMAKIRETLEEEYLEVGLR